jgi:hypothetical protein
MNPILQFTISNQKIERTDEFGVVEGSKNYLAAQFIFVTPDWDGVIKTAVFIDSDGTPHPSLIADDNTCGIPIAWLAIEQRGAVGVLGNKDNKVITTSTTRVRIKPKGYDGELIEDDVAQSYFDQIMQSFSKSKQFVTAEADRAEKASETASQQAEAAATSASEAAKSETSAQTAKESAEESEAQAKSYAESAADSMGTAARFEANASYSALSASKSASAAEAAAQSIKGDSAKTAADREQTGKDVAQTTEDRTQTAEDRQTVAADKETTAKCKTAAENAQNAAEDSANLSSTAAEASAKFAAEAAQSATASALSEQNAAKSEQNASQYSREAASAKTEAINAKDDAETAKNDAEAAQADIQESIDGVAQEATAAQVLAVVQELLPLVATIAESGNQAGSLNGFGLELGEDNSVAISYSDPDTGELLAVCTFPTETTMNRINDALAEIVENVKTIAEEDDAVES